MSHLATLSVSMPNPIKRSNISKPFQRHNSEELTAIDISPPRRHSNLLKSINPPFVENALLSPCSSCDLSFLAGYSWILRPSILLIWRVLMFLYGAVTLTVIAVSEIPRVYSLSFSIYCAQLISCCVCILSSCLSVFGRRKGFQRRDSRRRSDFVHVVDTTAIVLSQNLITLCLYNDIVVLIRDEISTENHAVFKLTHCYNLIPAGFELVLGCAEFRASYYVIIAVLEVSLLSSAFLARYVPWMPKVRQVYEDLWHDGSNASAVLMALQMGIIGILCAVAVMGAQKVRQLLIRRV